MLLVRQLARLDGAVTTYWPEQQVGLPSNRPVGHQVRVRRLLHAYSRSMHYKLTLGDGLARNPVKPRFFRRNGVHGAQPSSTFVDPCRLPASHRRKLTRAGSATGPPALARDQMAASVVVRMVTPSSITFM